MSDLCVLCVDDEHIILDAMRALLERWGCRVHTAQTVEAARALFAQEPVQAVFADYQLKQELTGRDLLSGFMETDETLLVALLPAEATPELSSRASERGIKVVRKPVDPDEIRYFLADADGRKTPYAAE